MPHEEDPNITWAVFDNRPAANHAIDLRSLAEGITPPGKADDPVKEWQGPRWAVRFWPTYAEDKLSNTAVLAERMTPEQLAELTAIAATAAPLPADWSHEPVEE